MPRKIKKTKLLILLGAGSSVSHGIPSVGELDQLLLKHSDWMAKHPPHDQNYFKYLWRNQKAYYQVQKPALRPPLNFEIVLGDLFALANDLRERPYGNPMRWLLARNNPPKGFRSTITYPGLKINKWAVVQSQTISLLSFLAGHMREKTRQADLSTPSFRDYCGLFAKLRESFDLGIYNLNYDNLALKANPDAFVGFDRKSGKFSPAVVHTRKEWNFVYHLHGSVHHSLPMHRIGMPDWIDDLSRLDFDDGSTGRSDHRGTEDQRFPQTTLVAGGWKIEQLQHEPYQAFYAALVRHLSEADGILIGGYGFGDEHIGRVLRNRMEHGTPIPVMVLDWADPTAGTDPMEFRQDRWSRGLCEALKCGASFREAGRPQSLAPQTRDLVDRKAFEVFDWEKRQTAIWYGGFPGAASRAAQIAAWLAGDEEALVVR